MDNLLQDEYKAAKVLWRPWKARLHNGVARASLPLEYVEDAMRPAAAFRLNVAFCCRIGFPRSTLNMSMTYVEYVNPQKNRPLRNRRVHRSYPLVEIRQRPDDFQWEEMVYDHEGIVVATELFTLATVKTSGLIDQICHRWQIRNSSAINANELDTISLQLPMM